MTESHNLRPMKRQFISWEHRLLIFHVHSDGYMITDTTVGLQWSDVVCLDADEAYTISFSAHPFFGPQDQSLWYKGWSRKYSKYPRAYLITYVMLFIPCDDFRNALAKSTALQWLCVHKLECKGITLQTWILRFHTAYASCPSVLF
jgi:hypothetical protein